MAYEDYEIGLIKSFGNEVSAGIIKSENTDVQSNKARTKYNRYISAISKIQPREYLTKEFKKIGQKEVLESAFAIIIDIFGEKAIPYAQNYFKILVTSNAKEVLNGVSLTLEDTRTGKIIEQVEIPDFETSSNIVTIVHEFAHYYLKKVDISYNKKRYYEEIMAILAEKIAAQQVGLYTNENDFYNQITEHRLETITWHYGKQIPIMEALLRDYPILERKSKTDILAKMQLEELRLRLPVLRTANGVSAIRGYYQNMADGYGIGFLYSESLLAKYLDDKRLFHTQLAKVTGHEVGLQQMLNYYGISATSNEVYDRVNNRLEEIKQFKRK